MNRTRRQAEHRSVYASPSFGARDTQCRSQLSARGRHVRLRAERASGRALVREMRTEFGLREVVPLVLATTASIFRLMLTAIPLGELGRDAAGLTL